MKTLFVCLALLALTAPARGETTVKAELRLHADGLTAPPTIGANAYIARPIANGWGVSAWLQLEHGWGEAYVGLTYAPRAWIELSLSAGIEQDAQPWRVAGSLWLGAGRFSSLTIVEDGGSGWWYQSVALVKVADWLKVGVMTKRFEGTGPRAELTLATGFNLWAAYLPIDLESLSVHPGRWLIGINRSF